MGHERMRRHGAPFDLHDEEHSEIGEERHADHLEDPGHRLEGPAHHHGRDGASRQERPEPGWARVQRVHPVSDGGEVGGDVERIGADEGH